MAQQFYAKRGGERASEEGVRAKKRPQKWRTTFTRSGEERERAKVCVRKRGHKSGAPLLRETGGEKRAKVLVRERGHKSGAAVSSNSDMQIGVPAEYCTTKNASDIFQSSLDLDEPIGKIWNKVGA